MVFHRPGLPFDLPHPEALWARVGAFAVVCAGLDLPDCVVEGGILRADGGPGDDGFWLARVAGNRFLLVGNERDSSPAQEWTRPVDPFEGAPDWLPWEWLVGNPRPDFAYWWDAAWARTAYPDDWDDDGLGALVGGCSDVDLLVWEIDFLALDADGPDRGPVREALRVLVARSEEGTVDAGTVAAVLGYAEDADPDRALETARFLGLTEDGAPREIPAGQGGPASGRFPLIGLCEWLLLVGDAMRSADELPRPADHADHEGTGNPLSFDGESGSGGADEGKAFGSAEVTEDTNGASGRKGPAVVAELAERVRGEVMGDADECVLVYRAPHRWGLILGDGSVPPEGTGVAELLERLREYEAHPERGRWLFARITVTRWGARLERAYDHWPEWGPGDPMGTADDLGALRAEMAARSPAWRPGWSALLDEETVYTPPWPGPPTAPSVPPVRLDSAGRAALIDRIGGILRTAAGGREWTRLRLSYWSLVGYAGGTLVAVRPDGEWEVGLNEDLRAVMVILRSATYYEGVGTWFGVELVLERNGGWRISYDRDGEPAFFLPPTAFCYALDARYFPRDSWHTPPWLAERLRVARG